MINKTNWRMVKKFLEYRLNVDLISNNSMRTEKIFLRYLLEWAQDVSFRQAPKIRPTFPQYLTASRPERPEGRLSTVYVKKVLSTVRMFFTWLIDNEAGYSNVKQAWVKTLRIKRLSDTPKTKDYVTLQDILTIAARPVHSLLDERSRAGLVFLFLSGMRINAFVSLSLQAVNIQSRSVYQYPSLGVRTKNSKAAKTFLLDIPELLAIVQAWDDKVRTALPNGGFWFAPLSPDTGLINPNVERVGEHRHSIARRNFKDWLAKENLPYYSPHKFRHGHIHYGLERSENVVDFKAVSLNAMHSSMEVTDTFYSVLRDEEVKNRISNLGKKDKPNEKDDLIQTLENLLSQLKNG